MATENAPPSGESDNQKQARLRRERLNTKLKTDGSERLNKITSLSGRPAAAEADLARSTSPRPRLSANAPSANGSIGTNATDNEDPAEVDISQMFARPPENLTPDDQQALFRQMLASAGPQPQPGQPGSGQMLGQGGPEDPMAQMLEQLLSGAGMEGGAGGLPAGLASMFGGQSVDQTEEQGGNKTYIWRIVHAITALTIGLYAALVMPFTGSQFARHSAVGSTGLPRVFYMFVTAELVLQTSRYFLDQGRLPASGILAGAAKILPQPWSGYARLISRYSIIWTTIVSDAMVIVFVLGCVAWWHGPLAAT